MSTRWPLLRNQRHGQTPSVVAFSRAALENGAHGITVHPRPDERHIRRSDVGAIKDLLAEPAWADREFNIEGNPLLPHFLPIVREILPTQATLVPDAPGQSTSDHGFDLKKDGTSLRPVIDELNGLGVRVSLFMDPAPQAMAEAKAVGADRVELYTEAFASSFGTPNQSKTTEQYTASARAAADAGLVVNAGHDLSLDNLAGLLSSAPEVAEVSIGHALVAECLHWGVTEVVRRYLAICHTAG